MSFHQLSLPWTPFSYPPKNTLDVSIGISILLHTPPTITFTIMYWNCLLITLCWNISSVSLRTMSVSLSVAFTRSTHMFLSLNNYLISKIGLYRYMIYIYINQVKAERICFTISTLNVILSSHHYKYLSKNVKCTDNWNKEEKRRERGRRGRRRRKRRRRGRMRMRTERRRSMKKKLWHAWTWHSIGAMAVESSEFGISTLDLSSNCTTCYLCDAANLLEIIKPQFLHW